MKISEGLGFFREYSDFSVSNIDKLTLETYPRTISGLSYQIPNQESLAEVQAELKKHLELQTPDSQTNAEATTTTTQE